MDAMIPQPSLTQIGLSVSTWFLMFLGTIIIRAETHEWVNTVMLAVIYPLYIWFMSRNNIVGSISQGAMIATVIAAGLFMTLLLEARAKSSFSLSLKKNLKEFGRKPEGTAYASAAIAGSLVVGIGVSYAVLNKNFIDM